MSNLNQAPGIILDKRKLYRLTHKEEINRYNKEYVKNHKQEIAARVKKRNHEQGLSKRYNHGLSKTKLYSQAECFRERMINKETTGSIVRLLQMVYEDNIKKYGTLTCYLCLKPIEFGKDSIDHKISLAKGGSNLYENLAVACIRCNTKKYTKTEDEYRKQSGLG